MICYEGCLNTDIRASLLEVLYAQNKCEQLEQTDIRKHCGVALEMLDNAQRYANSAHIRFEWHNSDDGVFIKIINHASKSNAENLMDTLNRIKAMSPDELKEALLEQLVSGTFGNDGGAGLGFLQIASRSGSHVNARIEPINEKEYLCESTFNLKRA